MEKWVKFWSDSAGFKVSWILALFSDCDLFVRNSNEPCLQCTQSSLFIWRIDFGKCKTFSVACEQENIESIFRETFSFHQFYVISKDQNRAFSFLNQLAVYQSIWRNTAILPKATPLNTRFLSKTVSIALLSQCNLNYFIRYFVGVCERIVRRLSRKVIMIAWYVILDCFDQSASYGILNRQKLPAGICLVSFQNIFCFNSYCATISFVRELKLGESAFMVWQETWKIIAN